MKIRPVVEADLPGIVDLRSRISGRLVPERGADFYRWKFFAGPNPARVFVAEAEGEVVAMTTLSVRDAWLEGELTQFGELGDFFTDPNFRRRGIFRRLLETALEAGDDLPILYCRPNDLSFPALLRYGGFHEHFQLRIGRRLTGVADLRAWLGRPAAKPKRPVSVCPAVPVGGWPAPLAEAIDAEVRGSARCALRRDPDTVAWRYGQTANPFRHFAVPDPNGPGGWGGVLTFKPTPNGDWALVEWHFLRPPPKGFFRGLWRFVAGLPDAPGRVHTWASAADKEGARALRGGGFVLSRPRLHFTVRGEAPPPSEWYFRGGDTDGF